jgi:hypothetical protein
MPDASQNGKVADQHLDAEAETDTELDELEPAEVPERTSHAAHVVELARELGLSDDQISAATAADLNAYVTRASAQNLRTLRQHIYDSQAHAAPAAKSKARERLTALKADGSYDAAIVEALEALADEGDEKIATIRQLQAELTGVKENTARQQAMEFARRMDAAINAIGRPDLFGKGSYADMDPKSRQAKRRYALAEQAVKDQGASSLKRKVKSAFEDIYADDEPAETPKKAPATRAEKVKAKWDNGGLARPTARRGGAEPPSADKAKKSVKELLRSFGQDDDE